MPKTAILRARVDSRRKARVEKILAGIGVSPSQAIEMFLTEIERHKALPFGLVSDRSNSIPPPIEQVARVWGTLDDEDFSHLDPR